MLRDASLAVKSSGSILGGDLVSYIPIFLAEDLRKNVDRGLGLGWNAIGIRSLQLKVKINAAIVSPSLSGWGVWDRADTGCALGPITKWKREDPDAVGPPKDFGTGFDGGSNPYTF